MKVDERFTSKLLVEGNDDQHVVWSLCGHHEISENFDVIDCASIDNVLKRLDLSVNEESSRISTVGVVIDADVDVSKRWASVQNILNRTGNYTISSDLPSSGLILKPNKDNKPIIGVWIMPNNNSNGMLEDFIAELAEESDTVLSEVDQTLSSIEAKGINKYKGIHKAKARIHTFLAWQEDPGTPMGLAITKKYLKPDSATCMPFVEWLNSLFNS